MAKPIELSLVANVNDFLRGTNDVEKALEGVGDELDGLAKEAGRSTGRMEQDFKSLAREVKDTDRVIDNMSSSTLKNAGSKTAAFKQEAVANFSEVTSSFSGSMTSITDLVQGTLGGVASGIAGPVGLAFGGAAVAVGLLGSAIASVGDAAEADGEKAAAWAQAYVDAGGKILTTAQTVAGAQEIILDPARYQEAKDAAEEWGVSVSVAVLALAGNEYALAEATKASEAARQQTIDTAYEAAEANRDLTKTEIDFASEAVAGGTRLRELQGEMAAGAQQADVFSEALRLTAENTEGASTTVDEFGDKVTALPDGTVIYIDAETGQATTDVDAIKDKIYSVPTNVDTTVAVYGDFTNLEGGLANIFKKQQKVPVGIGVLKQYGTNY